MKWNVIILVVVATTAFASFGAPAAPATRAGSASPASAPAADVLSPLQHKQVEESVERALAWLASKQDPDGSFPTRPYGQPGVTALCVLAFLSHGYLPGEGRFGTNITNGVKFILSCQHGNGILMLGEAEEGYDTYGQSHTGVYNHAFSALALSETYGMGGREHVAASRGAIEKAIVCTLDQQTWPKLMAKDEGGWRYLRPFNEHRSDMSVTSAQLLFLRSAKNAGFEVPADRIERASKYLLSCYDPELRIFRYLAKTDRPISRGMTGAGLLSLSLAGKHNTPEARAAAEWILEHPFDRYREMISMFDSYFYGMFYCAQGMFQIGGRYWIEFYPRVVKVLLANQTEKGHWHEDPAKDGVYGEVYTTALCVLTLDTPRQLLPIFQR